MLTCVVCEAKPAVALDVDGDRVCGECREIAADLLKQCPELSEPVECLTCGNLRCEDALCHEERQTAHDYQLDERDEECEDDTAAREEYEASLTDGEDDRTTFDMSDDADALASAGWGTDEDYGYFGGED